jgi:thioredoxin-like negative regulator of GroEL
MAEFIELNDSNFSQTIASEKKGLVYYYATWCGACRMASGMFKRVASELNLPIYKVEAEQNTQARSAVKIDNLPTLAFVRDGQIVASLCTTREEGLREFLSENGV